MGIIAHPIDPTGYPKFKGMCSFCDEGRSSAFWQGSLSVPIEVCTSCAEKVLPCLIADAVHLHPVNEMSSIRQSLGEVISSYWRGIAHRLSARERDRLQAEREKTEANAIQN
jgi:hypothetical protein